MRSVMSIDPFTRHKEERPPSFGKVGWAFENTIEISPVRALLDEEVGKHIFDRRGDFRDLEVMRC